MNGKKTINLLLVLIVISYLFVGCSTPENKDDIEKIGVAQDTNTNDQINPVSTVLKGIDLSGAKSLFISSKPQNLAPQLTKSISLNKSTSNIGEMDAIIYKVMADGSIQEAEYIYGDLNETETDTTKNTTLIKDTVPIYIENINNDYMLVIHGKALSGQPFDWIAEQTFLVRKKDGATFDFGMTARLCCQYPTAKLVQTDSAGNLYILLTPSSSNDEPFGVYKISFSADTINKQLVSIQNDSMYHFVVDSLGNLAYMTNQSRRYIKAIGGLVTLPGKDAWLASFFLNDLNGTILYYNGASTDPVRYYRVDAKNYTLSYYGTSTLTTRNLYESVEPHIIKNKKSVIMKNWNSDVFVEVLNKEEELREIPISTFNFKDVSHITSSDNYYYVVGESIDSNITLIKIDPIDDSYTTLLSGTYDVTSLTVSSDDQVVFKGLRYSDAVNVTATISTTGKVTIIDDATYNEVTTLVQVN